jgi:hypothetical protein
MPTTDECRAQAEECERRAAMAISDIVRRHFLISAASWRRMATVPDLAKAILRDADGGAPRAKRVER